MSAPSIKPPIAFYAPMKPPDHPVASGDRTIARLLMQALSQAGYEPFIASHLRSREPQGDPAKQAALKDQGAAEAAAFIQACEKGEKEKPAFWFTYHLYYKATDWIGPEVSRALGIPYILAEASLAPKRAGGPWDLSHQAVLAALEQASLIFPLNPANTACLPDKTKLRDLLPFLDCAAFQQPAKPRPEIAPLDPSQPWLVTAAMMRPGDKLDSYRVLARALRKIRDQAWQLLIIGDGPGRVEVEAFFRPFAGRVHFAGLLEKEDYAARLAACDLYAWPALREAFGMALLEAQSLGLPVVAGEGLGVAAVVEEGKSGLLSPEGGSAAFAQNLSRLLADETLRLKMGQAALEKVSQNHDLPAAAQRLKTALGELL